MPTAKARYAGDGSGVLLPEFNARLKQQLRAFYPSQDAEDDPVWGHPADEFVEEILSTARWAKSALYAQGFEVTTAELRAEHKDLLKSLRAAEGKLHNLSAGLDSILNSLRPLVKKLRNLSQDLDRFLGVDAEPLECADQIEAFVGHVSSITETTSDMRKAKKLVFKPYAVAVESAIHTMAQHADAAAEVVAEMSKSRKLQDRQSAVIVESTIRILRVLKQYQIPAAATGDSYFPYTSNAVRILKLIGDDLGLVRSKLTWRDIISEVKEQAPDLK
jgi:hypothetical protein